MAALRLMNPIAADAAKYFADLLVENHRTLGDSQAMLGMAGAAMVRALDDARLPGGPSIGDAVALWREHGDEIAALAIAMANYTLRKKERPSFLGIGVAAAVAVAVAALGA